MASQKNHDLSVGNNGSYKNLILTKTTLTGTTLTGNTIFPVGATVQIGASGTGTIATTSFVKRQIENNLEQFESFINASKKAFKSEAIYYTGVAGMHSTANSTAAAGYAYTAAGDAYTAAGETGYTAVGETAKAAEAYKLAGDAYKATGETALSKAAYKLAGDNTILIADQANTEANNAGNNLTLAVTKYTEASNYYTTASNLYNEAGENTRASTATNKASDATALASAKAASILAAGLVLGNVPANMSITGMNLITFTDNDDGHAYLPFAGMDFYFFGTNYGNSSNKIYMNTNSAFGFGQGINSYNNWSVNNPAILFDLFDSYNFTSYVSPPQNGTKPSVKYVRIVSKGTRYGSQTDPTIRKAYEIYFIRDNNRQYMLFNCSVRDSTFSSTNNITNGTAFQNTFGTFINTKQQAGSSYVITSDLNGNNWQFFPNTHLIL
jgi:tetratricopeptide (TPR) repeat protein